MSFKFVPFPLCHNESGFLHCLCFLHCLLSLCPCCVLAHPLCLHWVMSSQLPDLNLNIIFSEELFWTTPHTPSSIPPYFSESCHRSHSTSCLFSGYPLQWQLYICSCHYSNYASVSSSDGRPCESRKHLFLLTIVCPCLVQDLAIMDSVYICGIVIYMAPVACWLAGFLLSCYRLNPNE